MGADGCESGAETRCEDSRLRWYRGFKEEEVIAMMVMMVMSLVVLKKM